MTDETITINLGIVNIFKKAFPNIKIHKPEWAVLGIATEFRKMKVGDIVLFPVNEYNYQTIRSTPGSSMIAEVINEGRKWTTKVDKDNKSIAVLRIA